MSEITKYLSGVLNAKPAAPFLFVGSGFSRRYIGTEDWSGILRKFCEDIKDFDYYLASANGRIPKAASLLAADFHEVWWKSEKYKESRETLKGEVKTKNDALKVEIGRYFNSVNVSGLTDEAIQNELTALRHLNVDGIITTNWDSLLEELFPEYRVFVGQEELLFSNPQAIAEIYKIHGCASNPRSMVVTEEDYQDFQNRNPYLAAKLITLFIEHPIFFIGYSVNDPHIQSIIFSIAECLGSDKLSKFSENLLFIKRSNGKSGSVQKFSFSDGGRNVGATVFETDDFCEVYSAIEENKRKIPARILRYCKEQMYDLVQSSNPEEKLAVVDIDELDSSADVEFVVGIGVAHEKATEATKIAEEEKALSESGYKGLSISDVFIDAIADKSKFDPHKLLSINYPLFAKTSARFIPIFRYLNAVGVNSVQALDKSEYEAAKKIVSAMLERGFAVKSYKSQYEKYWKGATTADIIAKVPPEKVALFVPFQDLKAVDLDELGKFIGGHAHEEFRDPYGSFFKKLVCFYDWLRYGFNKA